VENEQVLTDARAAYDQLVKEQEVAALEAVIDEIGTPSLDTADLVETARSAYDAAASDIQSAISNYDKLTDAESKIVSLQADEVAAMIAALGEITLDSSVAVSEAQVAYDALSSDAQALVSNASVLTDAAAHLSALRNAAVQSLLSTFTLEEDKVRGLKFYYPECFPYYHSYGYWAADIRSFVLPYMGTDGNSPWLRLVYHYTADDWVFFKKVTLAVDDERYYKSFNYFDIVHDNQYGDVWETMDDQASDSDIEMLRAIANSTETIVRFEGDDYYRDITVSAKDKEGIKQVLTVYDALISK